MALRKTIIIPCYQSLKDPICEGLWLQYLIDINVRAKSRYHFILITLEQDVYKLSPEEIKKEKIQLSEKGIDWRPISYRTGGVFFLLSKLLMVLSAGLIFLSISYKYKIRAILGFASLSGSIAAIWATILRKKLIVYCYEPHSLYQVDFKIWKSDSLRFKVLNYFEKYQVRKASHLIVPTRYTKKLVEDWGATCPIDIMPVSVDEEKFSIDSVARNKIRTKYNISERETAILYLGKFDGIYYSAEEVVTFFSHLYSASGNYHFLVITPNDLADLKILFEKSSISEGNYTLISSIPYNEINQYVCAADIGLLAVPSLPSQKYRTPIKTANYLLCGLPYIVNSGVSEDDIVANKYKVGVVLEDLEKESANLVHEKLLTLMAVNKEELQNRCREVGLNLRKLSNTSDLLSSVLTKITS
ncbi:hypothetical protein [Ekhidna sp. To15]|uniref:hypothetical protein n=1 Tax=Ekhidna sp. To15 TaxID=3395267 RepID=UPI003F51DF86